jgi:hypothetical protein
MSDLLSKVCDLPFKHKFKASLVLSPIVYTAMAYGLYKAGLHSEDVQTFNDQFVDYFSPRMFALPFGVWSFLFAFSQVKQPRAKNFLRAIPLLRNVLIVGKVSEDELERQEREIELDNDPSPRTDIYFEAEKYLSEGKIGQALERIENFLETNPPITPEPLQRLLIDPFVSALSRAKTYSGNPRDKLRYLVHCTQIGRGEHAIKLLRAGYLEGNNLESRLLNAIALSSFGTEADRTNSWQAIYEQEKKTLARLGETRNQVLEIPENEYTQGIVIIKRGKSLEKEYQILLELNKLPYDQKITVRPLAFFRDGPEDVLVMYREAADNLDHYFNSSDTEIPEQANLALDSLTKFHSLPLPMKLTDQNPFADLERRFFDRFGESPSALNLRITFWNLLKKIETVPSSPIHKDAYPSNFLVGGRILDFEKASKGIHWFDFETFEGHPALQIYSEQQLKEYLRLRNEKGLDTSHDGREVAALVSSTCQIGSFSQKDPKLSRYFYERTLDLADQTGQRKLKDHLDKYLDPRFSQ